MQLTIKIYTDNDAFQDEKFVNEIKRIIGTIPLEYLMDQDSRYMGNFMDINGNTVGEWTYV